MRALGAILTVGCFGLMTAAMADGVLDQALRGAANEHTVVPFPAVPENWTQTISGTTVEYYSPVRPGRQSSESVVRLTYTKNTGGSDALGYIDGYIKKGSCSSPTKVGHGFYTTSCQESNTYAVVIGEVNNLYLIELAGVYDRSCQALIEGYVHSIISGKHNFEDRYIGDVD